ncbi:hypothetical protein K438DRAFT_1814808 [Mycena galopus ATCC 62051]|nr:hypothetical protein K438DRAFT_1814808 [Mycena galopus ATCC 62051]
MMEWVVFPLVERAPGALRFMLFLGRRGDGCRYRHRGEGHAACAGVFFILVRVSGAAAIDLVGLNTFSSLPIGSVDIYAASRHTLLHFVLFHLRLDNGEVLILHHCIDADDQAQASCGARSSPEAPQHDPRWSPLISPACGVRAVERVRRAGRGRAGLRGDARSSAICSGVCGVYRCGYGGGIRGGRVWVRVWVRVFRCRVCEHEHRCTCGHGRGRVRRRREREHEQAVYCCRAHCRMAYTRARRTFREDHARKPYVQEDETARPGLGSATAGGSGCRRQSARRRSASAWRTAGRVDGRRYRAPRCRVVDMDAGGSLVCLVSRLTLLGCV